MGRLFIVSAPSGAGKTTLCSRLLPLGLDLVYSVSYTTRIPRPGETDGQDYFFISEDRFREMIQDGGFLEWAEVFGRFYGTGRDWVQKQLDLGRNVLLDVDIAGARQIKESSPEAVFIFILPPTLSELGRRLRARHTETDEQLQERLTWAREEIEARDIYDYLIINDEIDRAVQDLACVIRAEGSRLDRAHDFWSEFFDQ